MAASKKYLNEIITDKAAGAPNKQMIGYALPEKERQNGGRRRFI
jgi:hypothetical protein